MHVWLCWVFVAVCRFLVAVNRRRLFSSWCMGFSLQWLLLLQLAGSGVQAQRLRRIGLVAPWQAGSAWTRSKPESLH